MLAYMYDLGAQRRARLMRQGAGASSRADDPCGPMPVQLSVPEAPDISDELAAWKKCKAAQSTRDGWTVTKPYDLVYRQEQAQKQYAPDLFVYRATNIDFCGRKSIAYTFTGENEQSAIAVKGLPFTAGGVRYTPATDPGFGGNECNTIATTAVVKPVKPVSTAKQPQCRFKQHASFIPNYSGLSSDEAKAKLLDALERTAEAYPFPSPEAMTKCAVLNAQAFSQEAARIMLNFGLYGPKDSGASSGSGNSLIDSFAAKQAADYSAQLATSFSEVSRTDTSWHEDGDVPEKYAAAYRLKTTVEELGNLSELPTLISQVAAFYKTSVGNAKAFAEKKLKAVAADTLSSAWSKASNLIQWAPSAPQPQVGTRTALSALPETFFPAVLMLGALYWLMKGRA